MGVTMTDKKSNDSRRKLLKSIAAGSGAVVAGKALPESWSKPIVDSVVLPAHAETTDDTDPGGPAVSPAPGSALARGPCSGTPPWPHRDPGNLRACSR